MVVKTRKCKKLDRPSSSDLININLELNKKTHSKGQ
jgi:hypothetical protein